MKDRLKVTLILHLHYIILNGVYKQQIITRLQVRWKSELL
jgi:hypothetical protein